MGIWVSLRMTESKKKQMPRCDGYYYHDGGLHWDLGYRRMNLGCRDVAVCRKERERGRRELGRDLARDGLPGGYLFRHEAGHGLFRARGTFS